MDELLIDDKKYLSTRRAAKVTGYAKDYIGQLCRGGRVKARQVGRSWYVLDTDIRQHRFGTTEAGPPSISIPSTEESQQVSVSAHPEKKAAVSVDHTWAPPRYAPVYDEPPQINLLKKEPAVASVEAKSVIESQAPLVPATQIESEPLHNLNEAWETWFSNNRDSDAPEDHVAITKGLPSSTIDANTGPEQYAGSGAQALDMSREREGVEESVPIIRKTDASAYPPRLDLPKQEFTPLRGVEDERPAPLVVRKPRLRSLTYLIRTVSIVLALCAAALAYLQIEHNKLIVSKVPAEFNVLTGSSVYTK